MLLFSLFEFRCVAGPKKYENADASLGHWKAHMPAYSKTRRFSSFRISDFPQRSFWVGAGPAQGLPEPGLRQAQGRAGTDRARAGAGPRPRPAPGRIKA